MDNYVSIQTAGLAKEPFFSRDNVFDILSIFLGIIFLFILIVAIFSKSTFGFWSKIKRNSLLLLSLINVALIFIVFIKNSSVVALYGSEYGVWNGPIQVPTTTEKIKDMLLWIPRLVGSALVLPIILIVGIFQNVFKKKAIKKIINTTNKI